MANLTPVIVPAKVLKGGRHKIRIAVSHNGETRYLPTDIVVDCIKEFRSGSIVKRPDAAYLNTRLRNALMEYQSKIDDIPYPKGLTCAELVQCLKDIGNNTNRTLDSVFQEYVENANIKRSTAETYRYVWQAIQKDLNTGMIVDNLVLRHINILDKAFRRRKLMSTTINRYMSILRTIVNYARKCGYVTFRIDPFAGYKMPALGVREAWLSVEQIKAIGNLNLHKKPLKEVRDAFMLSYYLGGINLIDLLDIDFGECMDTIRYVRKKIETRSPNIRPVMFSIPPEAQEIIKAHMDSTGHVRFTKRCNVHSMTAKFAKYMPMLAKEAGIDYLIYYSARKSFAQHAFDLGISSQTIDYILGHTEARSGSCLHHYLRVTPEMATDAIRKVLDNLK